MAGTKYWIGVASRDHVLRGVKDGVAMLNHGKLAPLKRMSAGDFLVYYAPKIELGEKQPYQKFVAVCRIKTGEPHQVKLSEDFEPFRLDVEYFKAEEAEIKTLIEDLNFIKTKNPGGIRFVSDRLKFQKKISN